MLDSNPVRFLNGFLGAIPVGVYGNGYDLDQICLNGPLPEYRWLLIGSPDTSPLAHECDSAVTDTSPPCSRVTLN